MAASDGYWYIVRGSMAGTSGGTAGPYAVQSGQPGDIPTGCQSAPPTTACYAGDYDGDGITDLAVFRPSAGQFWIASDGNLATAYSVDWGQNGDIRVVGDFDGRWQSRCGGLAAF